MNSLKKLKGVFGVKLRVNFQGDISLVEIPHFPEVVHDDSKNSTLKEFRKRTDLEGIMRGHETKQHFVRNFHVCNISLSHNFLKLMTTSIFILSNYVAFQMIIKDIHMLSGADIRRWEGNAYLSATVEC